MATAVDDRVQDRRHLRGPERQSASQPILASMEHGGGQHDRQQGRGVTHGPLPAPFLGPFRDDPGARFYAAPGKSPEETWREAQRRLGRLLRSVRDRTFGGTLVLNHERLLRWHAAIFGRLFADAGRYRDAHEPVVYTVPPEGPGGPRRPLSGAPAEELRGLLGQAFANATAGLDALRGHRVPLEDGMRLVARLYTDIIRIHPFVDGNHRVAFVGMSAALWSMRVPFVWFPSLEDMDRHDRAITPALLPEVLDPQPFADLLATHVKATHNASP